VLFRSIAIIQGHPTSGGGHFCHALAEAYARGAEGAGHEARMINVAELGFPLLRSKQEWESDLPPAAIREAQDAIRWAEHLLIVYPLWLGGMPAVLKGFFEQAFRPGFAMAKAEGSGLGKKLLKGKSARIVVTMGMPALLYRWYFGAHSLHSLERNILKFCGVSPIKKTLIGSIEGAGDARRRKWLKAMHALGGRAP